MSLPGTIAHWHEKVQKLKLAPLIVTSCIVTVGADSILPSCLAKAVLRLLGCLLRAKLLKIMPGKNTFPEVVWHCSQEPSGKEILSNPNGEEQLEKINLLGFYIYSYLSQHFLFLIVFSTLLLFDEARSQIARNNSVDKFCLTLLFITASMLAISNGPLLAPPCLVSSRVLIKAYETTWRCQKNPFIGALGIRSSLGFFFFFFFVIKSNKEEKEEE